MNAFDRNHAGPLLRSRSRPRTESQPGGLPTSIDLIRTLYDQGPHAALYTPLCKVKHVLEGCQYLVSTDGQRLSAVVAYAADAIEFTWSLAGRAETLRNLIVQAEHRLGSLSFAPVLETGRRSWSQMLGLQVLGRYFRAYLANPQQVESPEVPAGFRIVALDLEKDLEEARDLMNAAYPSLRRLITPERLRQMTETPYYFPDGWFFLLHTASGRRVGLAISGYCSDTREGFIEWTQIMPRLRHRGLGRVLVCESVRRLRDRARFITAAGNLDAPFVLGDLYKQCGFQETRQWTILGQDRGAKGRQLAFTIPPGVAVR